MNPRLKAKLAAVLEGGHLLNEPELDPELINENVFRGKTDPFVRGAVEELGRSPEARIRALDWVAEGAGQAIPEDYRVRNLRMEGVDRRISESVNNIIDRVPSRESGLENAGFGRDDDFISPRTRLLSRVEGAQDALRGMSDDASIPAAIRQAGHPLLADPSTGDNLGVYARHPSTFLHDYGSALGRGHVGAWAGTVAGAAGLGGAAYLLYRLIRKNRGQPEGF